MPIIAYVASPTPADAPLEVVDDRRIEFADLADNAPFVWTADAVITEGLDGFDMAPREVVMTSGGTGLPHLAEVKHQPAEMFIPVLLRGDYVDRLNVKAALRRFFAFRGVDVARTDGTFDVLAVAGGVTRRRRAVYKSGLEGEYTTATRGADWERFGLTTVSVWPFWRGAAWETPIVRLPEDVPFLSNDAGDAFGSLFLTPSLVLGADMPVFVPGEVPSPPVIEIAGPLTSCVITSPGGLNVTVGPLADGDVLFIDTGRDRRVELNGGGAGSGWAKVARGPQWQPLNPGGTTISFSMTGATDATTAQVRGWAWHESPWARPA